MNRSFLINQNKICYINEALGMLPHREFKFYINWKCISQEVLHLERLIQNKSSRGNEI